MAFILAAAAITACVLAILGGALLRRSPVDAAAIDRDVETYRAQLADIDRDAERGVIAPEEAATMRAEVGRRLLAADRERREGARAGGSIGRGTVAAALIGAIALSAGLYAVTGVPGLPDQPLAKRIEDNRAARAARMRQAEAEERAGPEAPVEAAADYLDLVAKLRETVAGRPNDVDGHALLVRHEAALGRYRPAYAAQRKVIELKGDGATAEDYSLLGELMILAAGGYVSPEAESALLAALNIVPREPRARYFAGLTMAQTGRPDVAFDFWAGLWREGPADAPWMGPITALLPEIAAAAGRDLPDGFGTEGALPGPDRAAVDAAGDLSADERRQMIEGMVARLAERIDTEGGSIEEHLRLIRAYGVLGRTDAARAAAEAARAAFGAEGDRARIDAAAREAGVTP